MRDVGSADARANSSIIILLAQEFVFAGSATEERAPLVQSISPGVIAEYILRGNYRCHVAVCRGQIVSVVAVKGNTHLYHLFVATDCQHRGLANRLGEHAKRTCESLGNRERYTVNTSANALGFYERLGFTPTGPPATKRGITATLMKLVVGSRRLQTHRSSAG